MKPVAAVLVLLLSAIVGVSSYFAGVNAEKAKYLKSIALVTAQAETEKAKLEQATDRLAQAVLKKTYEIEVSYDEIQTDIAGHISGGDSCWLNDSTVGLLNSAASGESLPENTHPHQSSETASEFTHLEQITLSIKWAEMYQDLKAKHEALAKIVLSLPCVANPET